MTEGPQPDKERDEATVTQVTLLLKAASAGDPQAGEALLPVVYEELRQLAHERHAKLS